MRDDWEEYWIRQEYNEWALGALTDKEERDEYYKSCVRDR